LQDPHLSHEVNAGQEALRAIINISVELRIPLAGFMASMGYFDSYRRPWLPDKFALIGIDQKEMTEAKFRRHLRQAKIAYNLPAISSVG